MRGYRFVMLPALLLTVAAYATANDDEELFVHILTCNLNDGGLNMSGASHSLQSKARSDGNGGYRIPGPFRFGEVCIKNASFSGAFGVFMASASLCDEQSKPLLDFTIAKQGRLTPKELPPEPGLISAFEAPNYGLVLFRGEPGVRIKPDPASKSLSYFCSYSGSGPQ